MVGAEMLLKVSGGQWEKKAVDAKRTALEFGKIQNIALLENFLKAKDRDVLRVGTVKIDGEAHELYQFSYTAQTDKPIRARNKSGRRDNDNLPSKIETRFDVNQQVLLKFPSTPRPLSLLTTDQ